MLWERLVYALISACFGALIGVAGWWLYGSAHSLQYHGPAMDPALRHWLRCSIAVFAVLGFVFKQAAADFIGDTLSAIFHFESSHWPGHGGRLVFGLVLLALCLAAIWFSTPH